MQKKLVLILLLLLLQSFLTISRCEECLELIGTDFAINTHVEDDQWNIQMSRIGDDEFVGIWDGVGSLNEEDYNIYGQRFGLNLDDEEVGCFKMGEEFVISQNTSTYHESPSVATISQTRFVVAYEGYGQVEENYDDIYVRVFEFTTGEDLAPIAVGESVIANNFTESSQRKPKVMAISEDRFLVAWESTNQDDSGRGIFSQVFEFQSGGNEIVKVGKEFQVNTNSENSQHNADASLLEVNSSYYAVYVWASDHASDLDVYGQIFNVTDTTLTPTKVGSEFKVNWDAEKSQEHPIVVGLQSGKFVVVWECSNNTENIIGQLYQFNETGTPARQGDDFRINTYTKDDQTRPNVMRLDQDRFVAVWQSLYQDNSNTGIFAQVIEISLTNEPVFVGQETQINDYYLKNQDLPVAVSFSLNDFIVGWNSVDQDGDSYGVFGRRVQIGDNSAPYLHKSLTDQKWQAGTAMSYKFDDDCFVDDDGEQLTYSSLLSDGSDLPDWITFNSTTREYLASVPDDLCHQNYTIQVFAKDHCQETSSNYQLQIYNLPPTVGSAIDAVEMYSGQVIKYTLNQDSFVDPEGTNLTYHAYHTLFEPLPDWIIFDDINLEFTFNAPIESSSISNVTVVVNDNCNQSVYQEFLVTVKYQKQIEVIQISTNNKDSNNKNSTTAGLVILPIFFLIAFILITYYFKKTNK
ncbi:dystroglycan [Anaeramoeba flamelloides]|uniref:Dystroglycan n=1 Tax=Anaeramoeba flamelloides TaxID=1746091 RepID=A0ABQ8X8L3_9EUKA|nr:dystroglycan [Anaeramoeba flamelloides]